MSKTEEWTLLRNKLKCLQAACYFLGFYEKVKELQPKIDILDNVLGTG